MDVLNLNDLLGGVCFWIFAESNLVSSCFLFVFLTFSWLIIDFLNFLLNRKYPHIWLFGFLNVF